MQGGAAIVLPPRLAGSRGWIWMERSLCAGRVPYPPGLRRRERPPYGTGETRRPPGKMQPPWLLQTHVGDDARTAPAGAFRRPTGPQVRLLGRRSSRGLRRRGVREGHAPPLHAVRARPAKWDCRGRPGERRAGCPHPAGPCGRAGFRGRDKSRPYGQILCSRQTGRPQCLPRFAGEGSAAGQAGPIWNRPLHGVFTAAGMFPVLNRQGAAGVNARPTAPGKHGGHPGKCNPRGHCKPM